MNEELLGLVRFYFAQSAFMTNCHFKASNRISKQKREFNNIMYGLTGSTVGLLILQIIGLKIGCNKLLDITAFFALILTGTSLIISIIKKDDYTHLVIQHRIFAEKYKSLRDDFMCLIEKIMSKNIDELLLYQKNDELIKRYSEIGEYAPETNYDDYQNAQMKLGLKGNDNEEFTWSDAQIDRLLPEKLRITDQN